MAQYVALYDRFDEMEKQQDYRTAVLVTIVKSALGDKRASISQHFPRLKSNQEVSDLFRNLKQRAMMQKGAPKIGN